MSEEERRQRHNEAEKRRQKRISDQVNQLKDYMQRLGYEVKPGKAAILSATLKHMKHLTEQTLGAGGKPLMAPPGGDSEDEDRRSDDGPDAKGSSSGQHQGAAAGKAGGEGGGRKPGSNSAFDTDPTARRRSDEGGVGRDLVLENAWLETEPVQDWEEHEVVEEQYRRFILEMKILVRKHRDLLQQNLSEIRSFKEKQRVDARDEAMIQEVRSAIGRMQGGQVSFTTIENGQLEGTKVATRTAAEDPTRIS